MFPGFQNAVNITYFYKFYKLKKCLTWGYIARGLEASAFLACIISLGIIKGN